MKPDLPDAQLQLMQLLRLTSHLSVANALYYVLITESAYDW